jgi:hypothetical protein
VRGDDIVVRFYFIKSGPQKTIYTTRSVITQGAVKSSFHCAGLVVTSQVFMVTVVE